LGLGAVAVGLSPSLGDEELVAALRETSPRTAFVTDAPSAARLARLRADLPSLQSAVVPDGAEAEGSVSWSRLLEFGATLDSAERPQRFRAGAEAVEPDRPACWHYGRTPGEPASADRLTHREAMARVRERLLALPARKGDRAVFAAEGVTLAMRLAVYALV